MKRRQPYGRWILRAISVAFLVGFIALPFAAILASAAAKGPGAALETLTTRAALHALWLTLWTAVLVSAMSALMGTITAWILVRYRFPGRGLLNAVVDLPFAIPTLVTGVMLVLLYGPHQALGGWLADKGVRVLFARPGIILALLFVSFPLVVRAVEPVLEDVDHDEEEAAFTLGAWPFATFRRVVLPAITPAVLTGALLTFARTVGEFGAVVIVAGNIPRRTLTAPVFVFGAVESGEAHAASAMSTLLILVSFGLILASDRLTRRRRRALEPSP